MLAVVADAHRLCVAGPPEPLGPMQKALPEGSELPYRKIVKRFVVAEDLAGMRLKGHRERAHLRGCDALGRAVMNGHAHYSGARTARSAEHTKAAHQSLPCKWAKISQTRAGATRQSLVEH